MSFDLAGYLKSLKVGSKQDDVPGTVDRTIDEPCPVCGKNMRIYKPCCGSPNGYKGCHGCNYKITLDSAGN